MKPGDEERSLTTGACWHSAYSSEVSPLQQKKDLLQDREREKKNQHSFEFDFDVGFSSFQTHWYCLEALGKWDCLKGVALWISSNTPVQLRHVNRRRLVFHRGALSPCAAHHFHYLLFLHAKAIFLHDPPIFEGRACSRLGGWSVHVFNIFWVALLGNRQGVGRPWVYRNNGGQLTET